ncbi:hypothetical protein VTN02DRAFT_2954 [Thermoascus thermophilus]
MLSIHSFTLFILVLDACAATVEPRASCGKGYAPCTPNGASNAAEDVVHLYDNLVKSVATASHFRRDALQAERLVERAAPLCCRQRARKIPRKTPSMADDSRQAPKACNACCWMSTKCRSAGYANSRTRLDGNAADRDQDKFTTNVYFASGWYGSITTGNFTSPAGETVNLITGDYADRPGANLYSADPAAQPNTATMTLPRPWTSKGVGSAIPASELGAPATDATSVPGTTGQPGTVPATTGSGRGAVVTDAPAASSTHRGGASTHHTRSVGGALAAGLFVLWVYV